MRYNVKTNPDKISFQGSDIEEALDYAIEESESNNRHPLWVENEEGEPVCLIVDGVLYMECDYKEAREFAEELEEGTWP